MLTLGEIIRSVYGVWRLVHADPAGMACFDATPEGFWRSFRVAILLLPAFALLLLLEYTDTPAEGGVPRVVTSEFRLVVIELTAYAISWMAFPLAAHYLAVALDREREYVGYIVAINWSAVLQPALFLPIGAIYAWELLPPALVSVLFLAAFLGLLAYGWFVAGTALKIGGLAAAGFVAVDVMLGALISVIKNSMI